MPSTPHPTGAALVAALVKLYTLGHPEIDAQHRRLFEIVAEADDGVPAAVLLEEVLTYAAFHFKAEEQIAKDHNVVDEVHIKAHRDLVEKIISFKRQTREITPEVRHFLVDWVTDHINREDRELVRRLRAGCTNGD